MEEKIKCTSCKRNVNPETAWICEHCGEYHHPMCSGEEGGGYGEYPYETEYSICKKCCKEIDKYNEEFDKKLNKK